MTATYHPVSPTVWDRTFSRLSRQAQVLALYVWTCPTRVTEGLFELRPGYIQADTGLDAEEITSAFGELHDAGLMTYDQEAEVVLDRVALRTIKYGEGDNRIKGAVRRFQMVPDTTLKLEFLDLAREHAPLVAVAIAEATQERVRAAERIPETPPDEAPSKPLGSSSEAPSREELSGEEERRGAGRTCEVQRCEAPATWSDIEDGTDRKFFMCDEHKESGTGFGKRVPIGEVA